MSDKIKIGIIGKGYVGNALAEMLQGKFDLKIYDPNIKSYSTLHKTGTTIYVTREWPEDNFKDCKLAIIAVPTEMDKTGVKFPYACNTSIVAQTVAKLDSEVILIKSTVAPGTTDALKAVHNKRIVFSPEYIGEGSYFIPAEVNFSKRMEVTPFWVLGGDTADVVAIYDILVPLLGPVKEYMSMSAKEAELVKYFENYFLGLKVVFANEMRDICDTFGVNYYNVREGWVKDPRVSKFHSINFKGKEGFSGKCLPKDLNALARACIDEGYNPNLLLSVLEVNNKIRKKNNLDLDY